MSKEIMDALEMLDQKISVKQREMAEEILLLKQGRPAFDDTIRASKSFGASVAKKFGELAEIFAATKSVSFKVPFGLDTKSTQIGAFSGGSLVQSHATITTLSVATPPSATMLVGNLPSRDMGGVTTAHYSRFNTFTGIAGVQPSEGGVKNLLIPDFLAVSQNAVTIAAICPITEQALKGSGELESVVDNYLATSVLLQTDIMLIGGTAVSEWPFSGYLALAIAYPSTYATIADAIADTVANMRAGGQAPDVCVINASTFLGIILQKNTQGDYLLPGANISAPQDILLHGCKIVFSSAAGLIGKKALVIDSSQAELGMGSEVSIEIGYSSDDFARNKRTIRAELSVIPTYRQVGSARLVSTTPA